MSAWILRLAYRAEYGALLFAVGLASLAPWRHCRRLAAALLPIAWPFMGRFRRMTAENLRRSDLDIPREGPAFRRLVREILVQALTTIVEVLKLPRLGREDLLRHMVSADEARFRAIQAGSRGVIVVAGHLGNWELVGQASCCRGYDLTAIARRQENPLTDGYLNRIRARWGMKVLFRGDRSLVRDVLRTLRDNGIVVFLSDQNGGRLGVPTRFLGRGCATPRGPVRFALRTGASLCFAYDVRERDGTHRLHLEGPIPVPRDGRTEEAIEIEVTQRLVTLLESAVRRHPEQWFWFLDRWRADPAAWIEAGMPAALTRRPRGRRSERRDARGRF
jgi:KDO2-lipid IV(A) lauroyltransferase